MATGPAPGEREQAAPPAAGADPRAGGLSRADAARLLREIGPNRLPRRPPPPAALLFLRQFRSPLIYILAAAGAVSLALGELGDAGFIAAVLVLNALIGGVQEWKADRAGRALESLLRSRATVIRDGEPVEIDAEEVVPGDLIRLESGGRVPADLELLSTQALEVDESFLTGESVPVAKDAGWRGPAGAPLADRLDMAWAGALVARGRGQGLVVATGPATAVGRLASDVAEASAGKPPLLLRLDRFARAIGIAVIVASLAVGAIGVLYRGHDAGQMFLFVVALAVAAIPEGLPVALTVALAVATSRMARRGVIVRRLAAVEGLGSCTLIASDKTGTLTCNQLTVRRLELADGASFDVIGEGYAPLGEVRDGDQAATAAAGSPLWRLARAAALCNEADLRKKDDEWSWRGDPTDVALLAFADKAEKAGGPARAELAKRHPLLAQIPFEPERRYAATFHRGDDGDGALASVKGAPEKVLAMCRFADPGERERHAERARDMAARGYRVLAFAEAGLASPAAGREPDEPENLEFLGLAGMIDPLRPGVREAVAACRRAGVATVMVTGDHPVTALAIARDLDLASSPAEVLTGAELGEMTEEELAARLPRIRVFARAAPDQKLRIVEAARRAGHFVAVTGDGVNDAPALRVANIGVAMGKDGTDVAREAADLVITDDNFATIVSGVEEGRVAYDNVRKVIYLLVSTGAAEVLLVILALAAGLPLPLLPVQLLWLNLVTNGIQDVALAFEPGERGALERPPRAPRERIFNRLMVERTVVGALVMGGALFLAFQWMIESGYEIDEARNTLLLLTVLFINVHIGNCRSETTSIFLLSPLRSPILLGGVVAAFGIHVAALYLPPLQSILGTAPIPLAHWAVLVAVALTIAVAMELHKLSWRRRYIFHLPNTSSPRRSR